MKTTIFELLRMIKDGKAPKKIRHNGEIYAFNEDNNLAYCYTPDDYDSDDNLFRNVDELDEEVEILETTITYKKDDKIKKLPYYDYSWRNQTMELSFENRKRLDYAEKRLNDYHEKINEIIDHLNNKQ